MTFQKATLSTALTVRAPSLASQLLQCFAQGVGLWSPRICRSRLAGEGVPEYCAGLFGTLRWQASSYNGLRRALVRGCRGPVGAGLPAKASLNIALAFRDSSLASQLLQWFAQGVGPWLPRTCRSRLAGEGVPEYCAGLSGLFAGKPAPMYGLAPTVYPLLKNRRPVASMYKAYSWKPSSASGQNWKSSWYADYIQASKASRSLGINPRRSYLGSIFFSKGSDSWYLGGRTLSLSGSSLPAGHLRRGDDKSGHSVEAPRRFAGCGWLA